MENLFLIGTGPMALEYAKVLLQKNVPFIVVGRGEQSAKRFEEETGILPFVGGVDLFLKNNQILDKKVIIATGTEGLMSTLISTLKAGASHVLIEKPAAISIKELLQNEEILKSYLNKVFVAYNRRFYASVEETFKLIDEDGGLQSMHFEFTEWSHRIEPLQKAPGVKENWFFANSTHVVDLAFFIAGKPKFWNCFSKSGELTWHAKTNFSGAGITEKGVLFSYMSNWESAGRWSIELLTSKRRIYLKPLEEIEIQMKGTINIEKYDFVNQLDISFKPGVFNQVEAFIGENLHKLCSLSEHFENSKHIYLKILV